MDGSRQGAVEEFRVRLAAEPGFRLGGLEVEPSTREVRWAGRSRTLEPRVMQVLVVLAQQQGSVVGRDELIDRCWDGRIVGDNAINRVISVLRRLAADTGAFRLETVTKVGYRLVAAEVAGGSADRPAPIDRRGLIVTGASLAVALAAGGALWWSRRRRDGLTPEAAAYLRDGRRAFEAARDEQDRQAEAYFRRATELAPDSSETWGALSLVLARKVGRRGLEHLPSDIAWANSAARRALELDPRNGEAEAAILLTRPLFQNWLAREREYRAAMARHPDLAALKVMLCGLLIEVGRWREATSIVERLVAAHPMVAQYRIQLAASLWGAERLADADRAFADAARLFPAHGWAWTARFDFLMLNGRPADAIASAADETARPDERIPMPVDMGLQVAGAFQSRAPGDVAAAVAAIRTELAKGRLSTPKGVVYLSGLGAIDEAFEVIEARYLKPREGIEVYRAPQTFALFGAAAKPLRRDARFADVVRRMGFETYWRETGVQPDFRRFPAP